MMNDNSTLTQLAAEMAQLRQQIEQTNQRLDMIYGAITRLSETKATGPLTPAPAAEPPFSAQTLLNPGTMLISLHQHALKAGLTIPAGSMERLEAELPLTETNGDSR